MAELKGRYLYPQQSKYISKHNFHKYFTIQHSRTDWAILSFIVFIIVSVYYIKSIAITVEAIQLVCATVPLVGIIYCICKDKASRIYKIIAISLACIVSGSLYKVMYICILGYEAGRVALISDLSWISFYTSLLYAYLRVFENSADFNGIKYRKFRLFPALFRLLLG